MTWMDGLGGCGIPQGKWGVAPQREYTLFWLPSLG